MEATVLTFETREDLYAAQQLIKKAHIKTSAMTALEAVCLLEAEYVIDDCDAIAYCDGGKLTGEELEELKMEIRDTMAIDDRVLDTEVMHNIAREVIENNGMEEV